VRPAPPPSSSPHRKPESGGSTTTESGESVAASSAYSFLSQIATGAFTAILTVFLVRALGPTQYGLFALALGVGALILLPADFGLMASTARFVAERRHSPREVSGLIADAMKLKLVTSGLVCMALVALSGPIASAYHAEDLTWPLRAVAVAVFGQSLMYFFEGQFVAVRSVATNVKMVFGESAVEFSASVVLVLLIGGASGAAAGRAVGYCCGGLLAICLFYTSDAADALLLVGLGGGRVITTKT